MSTHVSNTGQKRNAFINIHARSYIIRSVDEMLYYSPHPTEPSKTLLKQEATVTVHGVPLSHYMEDILTSRISSNAGNGRAGLEWVISKINAEVCVTNGHFLVNQASIILFYLIFLGERLSRSGTQEYR